MSLYPYSSDTSSNAELCLKWVDKNTTAGSAVVHSGCTFNIDDPTFYLPMTVMSGLASGFCERMAIAKLTEQEEPIISGATVALSILNGATSAIWTCGASSVESGYASNAEIAANVASNFALANVKVTAGTTTTKDIYFQPASSPIFQAPANVLTPPTSQASNYIQAFDSALQALLDMGIYKTNAVGSSAYQFDTLTASASAAASAATSSLPFTPTVSGGGQYTSVMLPAYPAQWAKERKWMLDQLKYTGKAVKVDKIDNLTAEYLENTNNTAAFQTVDSVYSSVINAGTSRGLAAFAPSGGYAGAFRAISRADGWIVSGLNVEAPYTISAAVPTTIQAGALVYGAIYFACDSAFFDSSATAFNDGGLRISNNTTITGNKSVSSYTILPGATVTVAGATIRQMTISAGAKVVVTPGTTNSIASCNIMSGGEFEQLPASDSVTTVDCRTNVYYDYVQTVSQAASVTYSVISTPVSSSTNPGYMLVVTRGGKLTLTGMENYDVRVLSGGTCINSNAYIQSLEIMNGGVYSATGNNAGAANTIVYAGGSAVLVSGATTHPNLDIKSGGYLSIGLTTLEGGGSMTIQEGAKTGIKAGFSMPGTTIEYYLMHRFGLQGVDPISSGWNLLSGTATAVHSACIAGDGVNFDTAKAYMLADTPDDVATAFPTLVGLTVNSSVVNYGLYPLAINGLPLNTGDLADHYTDFRVRQFPT